MSIVGHLVDLVKVIHAAFHVSDNEPDLYVPPLTPHQLYAQELAECIEYKENNPDAWKILFRDSIDTETLAFCCLPSDVREKLRH